ncbi:MAG: response regulator [Acidimicrobiales bacterium]
MTTRIVVVDDQALVRSGFAMIIGAEPDLEVVGQAGDGLEALTVVETTRPDLVLMDIRMPNLDGVEATRRLTGPNATHPTRVLILTTFDLDDYVFTALRAGASGFLLKDTPPDELIRAVRVVAGGDALIDPGVTRRLIEEFALLAGEATPTEPPPSLDALTDRELEVLRAMARGLSNAEIADELFVSETTVKTHVGRVLMKLHLRDRVQAVVLAYEVGLARPGGG